MIISLSHKRKKKQFSTHRTLELRSFATTVLKDIFHADLRAGKVFTSRLFRPGDRAVATIAVAVASIVIDATMSARAPALEPRTRLLLVLGGATTTLTRR